MKELSDFENIIDDVYNNQQLTTSNKQLAIWRVLTVYEDRMFFLISEYLNTITPKTEVGYNAFLSHALEEYKTVMKLTLDLVSKKCTDNTILPRDSYVNGSIYNKIASSYKQITKYSHLRWMVIATYNNEAIFRVAKKRVIFKQENDLCQYSVLQMIARCIPVENELYSDEGSGFMALLIILKLKDKLSIYNSIISKSELNGYILKYDFDHKLLVEISELHRGNNSGLPINWNFPWSNVNEFRKFTHALVTLCLYHTSFVFFGAIHWSVEGVGLEQRILVMHIEEFKRIISKLASIKKETLDSIINYLTYGYKTLNPDPSLQPLIIQNNEVFIAPYFITNLNFDRNALALHIRVDNKSFDKSSVVFEKNMTSRFIEKLTLSKFIDKNLHLPNKDGGEIDVITAEPETKTIVIFELKWMLTPSDPNEVFKKITECKHKITQAKNKLKAARNNVKSILNKLKIKGDDYENWTVYSFVIIDGFSGALPPVESEIKVLPQWLFFDLQKRSNDLAELAQFIRSNKWLPKQNTHYKKNNENHKFSKLQVTSEAIEFCNLDSYLTNYIPSMLEKFRGHK